MYNLSQLQKQQVGLRLPCYLIEQLDELANDYALTRTDLILEAIRSYVEAQKAESFYQAFSQAAKDVITLKQGGAVKTGTLEALINELEN